MLGKWNGWYKNIKEMGSFRYGNTETYQLAEDFLKGLSVEDWGCGTGGFKRIHQGGYIGIDGSKTPFTDIVVDLREYRSNTEGLMMRHVLEHNYDWDIVLANALASFKKRMVLVLFTPFQDETKEIAHNKKYGVDVPDIGFKQSDIEDVLPGTWSVQALKTKTGYGVEYIYFIER